MKPLVSYYGGKQNMIKNLLPLIPEHKCYVEPFCGGAALFFAKDPAKVNVLNDKNEWITTMYKVAKTEPERFETEIDLLLHAESTHQKAKHILENSAGYDDMAVAVACFVQCNMSFAKCMFKGFAFSKETVCTGWQNKPIKQICSLLRKCNIHNRAAIDIIKMYDGEKTLFYCDPPYINTDQGYYAGYSQDDYENLINLLSCIKGKFILSHYKNGAEKKDWNAYEFKTRCTAEKCDIKAPRTEYVYTNFDQEQQVLNFDL